MFPFQEEGRKGEKSQFYTSLLRFKAVTFIPAVMMAEMKNRARTSFGHSGNLPRVLALRRHAANYITSTPSAILPISEKGLTGNEKQHCTFQ